MLPFVWGCSSLRENELQNENEFKNQNQNVSYHLPPCQLINGSNSLLKAQPFQKPAESNATLEGVIIGCTSLIAIILIGGVAYVLYKRKMQ